MSSSSSNPPGSGTSAFRPRILLVDDDILILRTLVRLLKHARPDWETFTATDAHSALQTLKQSRFDVIVTDITMPGLSGTELVELVRGAYPTISCVIHSTRAHAIPESVVQQVHGVMQKPVSAEELCQVLDDALKASLDARGRSHS
jgi:DNA-binding NtrC family response regulator